MLASALADLPTELRLLAACCRWPHSNSRNAAIEAAAAGVDWNHFLAVVDKHRVAPLANDGLRRAAAGAPPGVLAQLSRSDLAGRRVALAQARETARLHAAFERAGLASIFLKGSTLALIAYGDLGLKQSWDIDLLIRPRDLLAATMLITSLGYEIVFPTGMDDSQLERFARFGKECVFRHAASSISLELHWRLADNPALVPQIGIESPLQSVQIGGRAIPTLDDEHLFAYLCAHGTTHGWARMKWLADVAALLNRYAPADTERLFRSAVILGAARTPAVTLILCHRLLGMDVPGDLLAECEADPACLSLAATAVRCLAHGGGAKDFDYYSATGMRFALSSFTLVPGSRYLRHQVRFLVNSAEDRARLSLPAWLTPLHYVLRVSKWLVRLPRRLLDARSR